MLLRFFWMAKIQMTYCVAMRLEEGLMFVSDSRTNAGLDHIALALTSLESCHIYLALKGSVLFVAKLG
jgi:hypothetical protein